MDADSRKSLLILAVLTLLLVGCVTNPEIYINGKPAHDKVYQLRSLNTNLVATYVLIEERKNGKKYFHHFGEPIQIRRSTVKLYMELYFVSPTREFIQIVEKVKYMRHGEYDLWEEVHTVPKIGGRRQFEHILVLPLEDEVAHEVFINTPDGEPLLYLGRATYGRSR